MFSKKHLKLYISLVHKIKDIITIKQSLKTTNTKVKTYQILGDLNCHCGKTAFRHFQCPSCCKK